MTDYHAIYDQHAEAYDRMVRAEDCDGRLGPALAALVPLQGAHAVEVGVGTGRVTELLLERGCRVTGFDAAPAMLEVAERRLGRWAPGRCTLQVADARRLPVASGQAELAVAGWVFGHLRSWEPEGWRAQIGACIAELMRALRPGGTALVIETLGTGTERPGAPRPELAEYYAWLESAHGFTRTEIPTDYGFASAEEAARATAFFFGEAFAERIRTRGSARIPEWTGLWHRVSP